MAAIPNQPSRPERTSLSKEVASAVDSITTGDGESKSGLELAKMLTGTSSTPSPPTARFTTLVSVTKLNNQILQIEVWDDYENVVAGTTGARGGSHWSWKGTDPRTGRARTLIVKIDDVSDITITPWNEIKNATT